MTSREAPIYGGRRGGGEEKRDRVWLQRLHACGEVIWEKLSSKNTYRVLFLAAYSILMLWVMTNVGHMAGNVGQLAEEDSFWRHARRLAKKTVQFQAAVANAWSPCTNCTETAPKLSINLQTEGAGVEEEEEGERKEGLDTTGASMGQENSTHPPPVQRQHEEESQEGSGGGERGGGEGVGVKVDAEGIVAQL